MIIYGPIVRERRVEDGVFEYVQGKFKRVGRSPQLTIEKITVVSEERQLFEDNEAVIRFEKDLDGIYFFDAAHGHDPVNQFLTPEGELDTAKVYYQGTSLGICYLMQDVAYACLNYTILMSDDYLKDFEIEQQEYLRELRHFSKQIIELYKSLRETAVNEKELRYIRVLLGQLTPRSKKEKESVAKLGEVLNIAQS